ARRPKMLTAASRPIAMPIGSTSHCTPKISPMPKTTSTDSRNAPTIRGTRRLSSRRCILNASKIWRRLALAAARFSRAAAFLAALSSLGFALAGIPRVYGHPPRPAGGLSGEQRARFLAGGALVCEVGQRGRELLAAVRDRLGVEPPRPVRRAHQRPGHHTGEPDLRGRLGVRHELLGL